MSERLDWQQFWPFYLQEHSDGRNRAMHFVGTTVGFVCLVLLAVTLVWWWFLVGLFAGYLAAWIGHFAFEKNRPATFQYPLKSFASDWRLWALTLAGRTRKEYERLGVEMR